MNVSEATVTKQGHHLARIYMGQTLHLNKIKYFIIYISGQQGVAKGADNIYTIWCAMTHAKSKTKYGLGMVLSNFFKMYHHFLFWWMSLKKTPGGHVPYTIWCIIITLETRIYMDLNSFQYIWYFPVLWSQNNPIGSRRLHFTGWCQNTLRKMSPSDYNLKHDKSLYLLTCNTNIFGLCKLLFLILCEKIFVFLLVIHEFNI